MHALSWQTIYAATRVSDCILVYKHMILSLTLKHFATTVHKVDALYIDGLVQGCSKSSTLAMELIQFCTKLSI